MSHPTGGTRARGGAQVVVVGSANADLIVTVTTRPGPGETVIGGDLATLPGGKGANQAVAAARLGARVAFVGCVGHDPYAELLVTSLHEAGVDVSALRRVDAPTGIALITVTPDGDNSIIVSPGANASVTTGDVDAAVAMGLIGPERVLVLQRELRAEVVEYAARTGARAGARVVLNLAPPGPVPPDVLAVCDPLVVNEHEAAALLQWADGGPGVAAAPERALEQLLALGARSGVITLGARGAVTAVPAGGAAGGPTPSDAAEPSAQVRRIPALPVDAVDTTGAGDAFTGALAWRLACGDDLPTAAQFAVRVASTAVLKQGAQTSFPRLDEVLPAPVLDAEDGR